MDYLHRQYINEVKSRLRNFKAQSKNVYNFSCPFCGDSKTDRTKARGYLINKGVDVIYYCHNDQSCNAKFDYFLFKLDKDLAKRYRVDRFKDSQLSNKDKYKQVEHNLETVLEKTDYVINLPAVKDLDDEHIAKKYVTNRKIPQDRWSDLYYTDNYFKFVNELKNDMIFSEAMVANANPRLIIPLRKEDGTLFALQGRALYETKMRYLTEKLQEYPKIYGLDKLKSKDEMVFFLEGPIDSMFVDNGLALTGSDISLDDCPYSNNRVFVLDNEPHNKTIVKKYKVLVKKGEKVISWLHCPWKGKDINEMITDSGASPIEINTYLKNNIKSGLAAELDINQWAKV